MHARDIDFGPLVHFPTAYQRGYNFRRRTPLRGRGFFPIYRYLIPLVKKGLATIASELFTQGQNFITKATTSNAPVKEIFQESKEAAFKNLKEKADKTMKKVLHGEGVNSRFHSRNSDRLAKISKLRAVRGMPQAEKKKEGKRKRKHQRGAGKGQKRKKKNKQKKTKKIIMPDIFSMK